MTSPQPQESSVSFRLLTKAWFSLTSQERLAILVVLGLLLLGMVGRYMHLQSERNDPPANSTNVPHHGRR